MKNGANFFKVWGGISGAQHLLALLLTTGHVERGIALTTVARLTSFNVASRFKLPPQKGAITLGADADLALVDRASEFVVKPEGLFYRHRQSPYVGRRLQGRVVRTLLRGQTIYAEGRIVARPAGRLVKPVERRT
jgi:allantoinase